MKKCQHQEIKCFRNVVVGLNEKVTEQKEVRKGTERLREPKETVRSAYTVLPHFSFLSVWFSRGIFKTWNG